MEMPFKLGSTKHEVDYLVRLEKLCGVRVANKTEDNAIAICFESMNHEVAYSGTVYRWLGVMNQVAFDILNDEKRKNVLETGYIVNKMKEAMKKEKKSWEELEKKRKDEKSNCVNDEGEKNKKKRKKRKKNE